MNALQILEDWKTKGVLRPEQYELLTAILTGQRFSLYREIEIFLYLGVIAVVGGVGWTIKDYFVNLGDFAIISGLTLFLFASIGYCFLKGNSYTTDQDTSSDSLLNYLLYLGCLLYGVEMSYLQWRYSLFGAQWDYHFFLSAFLFFGLAYRFDNRFVLSLGISSLSAWFGFRLNRWGIDGIETYRLSAIGYGFILIGIGFLTHLSKIKMHFLNTYIQVGSHFLFIACLSGLGSSFILLYTVFLIILCFGIGSYGVQTRQFSFVLYSIVYGYIGMSYLLLTHLFQNTGAILLYCVLSSLLVIAGSVTLSKRLGEEEGL